MTISSIHPKQLDALAVCFNEAFANYFVPFNIDANYLFNRWKAARVDYDLSFAAFDQGRPIAFIINGLDDWDGRLCAFNTGTGVLPEYRGQRLVDRLYEVAFPRMKSKGVEQCRLEVITKNERAIRVYSRIGFSIERSMDCFNGSLNEQKALVKALNFEKVKQANWEIYEKCHDFQPSWDNVQKAIQLQNKFEYWEARLNDEWVGYVIISPKGGYVPQFGIHPQFRQRGLGRTLFYHLQKVNPNIRLNNIDQKSKATIRFLTARGLEQHISQHEMAMMI